MTYQSTVRRLTLVTAILVAIGLTLFLTAPFGKGVSLAQASAENNPATGAPTISGTTQVGETLTADITGIADADGLSGETFTYQWVSGDGTTDTDMENATGSTYTLVEADKGKSVKVRVTFTDGGGNEETLTSAPTGPVWGDGRPGAPRNLAATPGNKEVTLSWEPPADNGNAPATGYRIEWRVDGKDYENHWGTARSTTYTTNVNANLANGVKYFFRVRAENGSGNSQGPYGPASGEVSATPTSGSAVDLGTPVLSNTENLHHGMVRLDWEDVEDAGWYVVQYYHVKGGEWLDLPAEGVDIAFHGSSAVVSNLHGLSWLRVGAMSCAGASEWSQIEQLFGTNASDWEGVPVPEVEEGDEIEPCPVVLGTPVLSDTETLHHGMVKLDWQDIEDAGWYVVQYYHVKGGEWLDLPAEGVDIAFHGSSAVVSDLHGLSWLRVRAMSCAGESEWSQIEQLFGTNASDWEGVPVPEVAEGDEIEPCSEDADTSDNSPATGAPTISGTAQVGEALTVDTSGIADADGLTSVTYSYQWLADDAEIAGATSLTYTLADTDEGKAIKAKVSFTDDVDNEETLTSAATPVVAVVPVHAKSAPDLEVGTPWVAHRRPLPLPAGSRFTLSVRVTNAGDGASEATRLRYYRSTDSTITSSDTEQGSESVGALAAAGRSDHAGGMTAPSETGTYYYGACVDSVTNESDTTDNCSSAHLLIMSEPAPDLVVIGIDASDNIVTGGSFQVGVTVTNQGAAQSAETTLRWKQLVDGTTTEIGTVAQRALTRPQSSFKTIWLTAPSTPGTSSYWACVDSVAGEYDTTNNCSGKVTVTVTNNLATGAPTISGTSQVGQTLTADTSGIADADGLANATFSYQWLADDTDIAGATGLTYTLTDSEESKAITVQVSFTDDAGNQETLTSAGTAAVSAANTPATGAPAISGTAQVGETLTANTTGVVDEDGLSNVQYEYQWLADDADISGATNATYTLADTDEGKTISVQVGFTDDAGNEETLTSAGTAAVSAAPAANSPATGTPTISGTAQVGETLTAGTSGVADADGLTNAAFTYQWLADDADISGATNATYTLEDADEGKAIKVQVGFTDDAGNEETLTSAATAAVAARPDSPLSDLDRLRRFIATDVVEAHESGHPWLRTTWEYMKSGVELTVGYSPHSRGSVEVGCSYEDGLRKCRAEGMEIGVRLVDSLGLIIHEMAHIYSLTNGLVDEPAPLGAAYLYFDSLAKTSPLGAIAPSACRPAELFADILQLSVVGVSADQGPVDPIAGYWHDCTDYQVGQADPLTEEALTVVRSALSGQLPQWFADTYHDSSGNADLEQLWRDVKSMEMVGFGYREGRYGVAYRLRDQFGGYCGNPQVARVLDIVNDSERVSNNEIRNPWRDGGCVPEAPGSLRVVPGSNQMELSWEAPVDDGGSSIRGYVVEWKSGDEDYDESRRTVIDDPSSNSHTVTGLTEGVEHTLRVTAFNVFGDGEYAAVTNLNRPATGAPPISGTARVGETLTASTSGIADEDGLSDPTYSYKWIRNDGTTDSVIRDATSSTYTLTDDDAGKTIKVRVSFTDDGDNEETLTSDATAVVAATVPGVPEHVRVTPHDSQALDVSWEAPASDGGSAVTGYKVQWKKATGSWDTPEDVSEAVVTGAIHTIAGLTEGTAYSVRVLASNDVGDGSASAEQAATPKDITPPSLSKATVNEEVMTLTYDEALDENSVPASETFSVTTGDGANTVDSVSVSGSAVTLTLSSAVTTDVAVTVSYNVPTGQTAARIKDLAGNASPALSSQTVVNVTEQSGNDNPALWSATMTVGVSSYSPGLRYYGYSLSGNLGEISDDTITLDGSVYTLYKLSHDADALAFNLNRPISSAFLLQLNGFEFASHDATIMGWPGFFFYLWPEPQISWSYGDQVQVSVVQVETSQQPEPVENTPATGLPTITGTAQVGETLSAVTTDIFDADGLTSVSYSYQWISTDSGTDADIAGKTGSTYELVSDDQGKTIKVRVTFTDDAGNEETLTSAATDAVAAAPQTNSPATGAPDISGTAQVGETLTADTSGIADADGLGSVQYEYQWLAADAEIAGATSSTYTLLAEDEGQVIKVRVSFTDDADNEETLTSAATEAVSAAPAANSPATGVPTISGTAQVGETLTANTSGVADADGLSNVQYEYRWLADDAEISGATNATYTLTDSEESKAITVQVSFTDDAGNEETLTSAATAAVAGAQPTEPPDKPTGLEATATHDSVTLTWDNPGDDTITGYVILRRIPGVDPEGHFDELVADTGTDATTYTDDTVSAETRYTYRIKAINGAGTSERSRWSHIDTPAAPVPDKPTGLEATESHGQVVLTWDDPGDDSITGYVILRRVRENNTGGDFSVLVADTGTAATTFTDDTVAAGTTYTYRIKAINEHGTSERSRWYHIDIPAAP